MGMLFLLADPRCLGWGVTVSKVIAAETALANNFLWNEMWTFRPPTEDASGHRGWPRRFLLFNLICSAGIGLSLTLLHLFYTLLELNLYFSNILTIGLTSVWNYALNSHLNWRMQ
ncbi:GtrA family protein [Fontisphaera persica]|uniref:GtrA family protein n=1 Tax=Fontisphaera persica TaxID=2974023 RepID=UPI0024BF4FB8|nr:GtrA family protein [Fontisphaera persica]WCJ61120.1 GtrA family protein [Fontisphaera persica]